MISFGNRIEPLVDTFLLEDMHNLSFRYNKPQNCGKVLGFDQPWENPGSLPMTVLADEENIKLYYRGYPGVDEEEAAQVTCLSVSEDAIHFTPYPVNEIAYHETTENNIILKGLFSHTFAPFYDTNPACKPEERYKAIGGKHDVGGIWVFASPDGIHWKPLVDHAVITKGNFDSMNMAFWNPHTQKYYAYSRIWDNALTSEIAPNGTRKIQSCTSVDFINWTDPVTNVYQEPFTDQLYTNAVRPIPGAEHLLISLPMRFHEVRLKYEQYNRFFKDKPALGVSDALLMTSRDPNGVHWDRSVKEPWLSGGLYEHEWTHRCFITAGGIIPKGDNFYFYVGQNYMWEDDGIWAYSIPRYRFMSLFADETGGSFTTKPLNYETDDIFLNYATSAYGYVKVTLLDETGTEIFVSDEIFGNELSHNLHVDGLAGKIGTMRVELKEAHLYALGSNMCESR